MKKGEHFRRRKRKGKERKHFGRRRKKGKERKHFRGRNGKERKHFTEKKEGKKIRKEEKACRGSHSNAAGYGELSFCYSRGLAYRGIIGGIACGVRVNG